MTWWFGSIGNVARLGSLWFFFWFSSKFFSPTYPPLKNEFLLPWNSFSKKNWNRTWKSNHFQVLCVVPFKPNQFQSCFTKPWETWNKGERLKFFIRTKFTKKITHSWVGLMLQNSWQLQLIWKLIILICFHRALFFTSQVCRFCWVPNVYFTSSRCLNTLLPAISILSNLITLLDQGDFGERPSFFFEKGLVTYFQNGRTVKEWSANPEFEPGDICMWFYRISTKMNHQEAIPRQMITRVCI